MSNTLQEDIKRDYTVSLAYGEAIKYSIFGGIAASAATLGLNRFSTSFNKFMSISAKTSLPVMASLFVFTLQYELTLHDIQRNPAKYGIKSDVELISKKKPPIIPFHHKVINYLDDHPFQMISILSTPLAAAVLYQQLPMKNLKLSQRLMHSRVYTQSGIIGIIVIVMALKDYASKHRVYYDDEEGDEQ